MIPTGPRPGDPAVADPGAAKGARDVELPPWSKGRYGSAVGRAVHGVLQTVDLATGDGLDQAVAAQCLAEGVTDFHSVVKDLVRSALDRTIVRAAAVRPHWRETYVGTELDDGTVLEGIIDLLFRDDDGTLVIVDYKTDAVPAAALPARVDFYRPQVRGLPAGGRGRHRGGDAGDAALPAPGGVAGGRRGHEMTDPRDRRTLLRGT